MRRGVGMGVGQGEGGREGGSVLIVCAVVLVWVYWIR